MKVDGHSRNQVRPLEGTARRQAECIRPGNHVKRHTAKIGYDAVDLPASQDMVSYGTPLLQGGHLIHRVSYKRLPAVEVCITRVERVVKRISCSVGERFKGNIRDSMSPRVGRLEGKSVSEATIHPNLKCVVMRITGGLTHFDRSNPVQSAVGIDYSLGSNLVPCILNQCSSNARIDIIERNRSTP